MITDSVNLWRIEQPGIACVLPCCAFMWQVDTCASTAAG
jgi:hypothetical protein